MPAHLTAEEAAALALTPEQRAALGLDDMPLSTEPAALPEASPQIEAPAPVVLPLVSAEPTRTFQIIRAALDLSSAMLGAPRVTLDGGSYLIYTAPSTRLRFTFTENAATTITTSARVHGFWVDLDSKRMRKLTPEEFSKLLVLFQQGVN